MLTFLLVLDQGIALVNHNGNTVLNKIYSPSHVASFEIGQKFALMEEKVVISSVLRRYHVKSLDKQENVDLISDLILRPKNGRKLQFVW